MYICIEKINSINHLKIYRYENISSIIQTDPQAIINSLLAYLCTHDSYYPWYQYIANTYDNSITDFHYDETDYFEHLTNLIQDFKVTEILVYYNTDDEFFTFNTLQEEPMADTDTAEDTYKAYGITFYLFKD